MSTAASRSLALFLLLLAAGPALLSPADSGSRGEEEAIRRDASVVLYSADGREITRIDVEIADTAPARKRGLMGRMLPSDETGMLFVFPDSAPRSFWMRNTPGSLDILFADSQRRIISIARKTEPFSQVSIPSRGAARYALEVRGGFASRWGIVAGARFEYYPSPFLR